MATSIPTYQASGLASNMDTQGIIEKLVAIEGAPLATIAKKQAGVSVQVSSLGSLMSALDGLSTAAKNLGTGGITTITGSAGSSDYSVSGTTSTPMSYTMKVEGLARAAKSRSTTMYANGDAVVSVGAQTLSTKVDGQQYNIAVAANTKLKDLVTQINASTGATTFPGGAAATLPFTASLMSDGTQSYITLTNKSTGFVVGQPASSALSVVSDIGLGLGTPVGLEATNSVTHVDGLRIERRNNELTDVITGVTVTLKNAGNTDSKLNFASDNAAAESKLNAIINNYNKVAAILIAQADTNAKAANNTGDKLGSSVVLGVRQRLQSFVSQTVNTTGSIRTLRDLGIQLQKDGSVKLDSTVLNAALAKDPEAVNRIFSKTTTGLGDTISAYVKGQTDSVTGALVARRNGLDAITKSLTKKTEKLNIHLEAYRRQLNIQFAALENVMSGINNIAKFLDSQDARLRATAK